MRAQEFLAEKWSKKYKSSINCSNPKGFSQRAHCAGRKKKANEDASVTESVVAYHGNQGGIDINDLKTPMWWCEFKETAEEYAGDDGFILTATLTCKNPYVIKDGIDETNTVLQHWRKLAEQGYDSIYDDSVGDWIPFYAKDIHVTDEFYTG